MKELEKTGVIGDTQQLVKTARAKLDFIGEAGIGSQDLGELSTSFKEMLQSIRGLIDEVKIVVEESKKSTTLRNVEQTIREASDTYRAVKKATTKVQP